MAKDIFHDTVKQALQQDGWQITHDPLTIPLSKRNIFIDLGGQRNYWGLNVAMSK